MGATISLPLDESSVFEHANVTVKRLLRHRELLSESWRLELGDPKLADDSATMNTGQRVECAIEKLRRCHAGTVGLASMIVNTLVDDPRRDEVFLARSDITE